MYCIRVDYVQRGASCVCNKQSSSHGHGKMWDFVHFVCIFFSRLGGRNAVDLKVIHQMFEAWPLVPKSISPIYSVPNIKMVGFNCYLTL